MENQSAEVAVLLSALEQAPQPLTVKQLRDRLSGPFKLPEAQLAQLLDAAVAAGRAHRFAGKGKKPQPRYWTRDYEQLARAAIRHALAARPLTRSQLWTKLKAQLADFAETRRRELLSRLLQQGEVYEWPAYVGGRTKLLGTRPPDARFYFEDAADKIAGKLKLTRAQALDAAKTLLPEAANELVRATEKLPAVTTTPSRETTPLSLPPSAPIDESSNRGGATIQRHLAQLKPGGGLVSTRTLWHLLRDEGWSKADFERAALQLAAAYRVALHEHNFPASLSAEERAEMLSDGQGRYFVGMALR